MKKSILPILIVVILLFIAGIFYVKNTDTVEYSEGDVRALVQEFGTKLKNVSLLDEVGVSAALEKEYGPYASEELLRTWQEDPSRAPGRVTSSPWPDRIEISTVTEEGNGFEVTGYIVDVSNEGGGIGEELTEVSRRPIILHVLGGDDLRITDLTLLPYVGDGEWITKNNGIVQFMYPEQIQAEYISAPEWPPKVSIVNEEFLCIEGERTGADGLLKRFEKRTIDDRVYCRSISSEGAAGSTYTTYVYQSDRGDNILTIVFTLRFPQCMNYDDPEQSVCKTEQDTFDIDGLVDRIASSVLVR